MKLVEKLLKRKNQEKPISDQKLLSQLGDRAVRAWRDCDGVSDNQDKDGRVKARFIELANQLLIEEYGQ